MDEDVGEAGRAYLAHDGEQVVLILTGEWDLETAPALEERLLWLAVRDRHVTLDLAETSFVGAAFLNALSVGARAGLKLSVRNAPPVVRRLLGLGAIADIVTIED